MDRTEAERLKRLADVDRALAALATLDAAVDGLCAALDRLCMAVGAFEHCAPANARGPDAPTTNEAAKRGPNR